MAIKTPLTSIIEGFGRYIMMIWQSFRVPQNIKIFKEEFLHQSKEFITQATPIILVISVFAGAVTTVQIAGQLSINSFVPSWMAGKAARDTIFLEITPTFNGIVLAGVIGSKLTSELGNMRLTEQIDALEIMGINSKIFLIFPRVSSIVIITPFLSVISLLISIFGGKYAGIISGILNSENFNDGFFKDINFTYIYIGALKAFLYAFIYSSVGCYFGYFVKGGAIDIGKATTKGVIVSCIFILLSDFIVTTIFV